MSILCRIKEGGNRWAFTCVYGPCDHNAFGLLQNDLHKAWMEWDVPWCVGGDFNAVRHPKEGSGASRMSCHMKLFNTFIQEFDLVDLPLRGA